LSDTTSNNLVFAVVGDQALCPNDRAINRLLRVSRQFTALHHQRSTSCQDRSVTSRAIRLLQRTFLMRWSDFNNIIHLEQLHPCRRSPDCASKQDRASATIVPMLGLYTGSLIFVRKLFRDEHDLISTLEATVEHFMVLNLKLVAHCALCMVY
jgi:hypothetical protein